MACLFHNSTKVEITFFFFIVSPNKYKRLWKNIYDSRVNICYPSNHPPWRGVAHLHPRKKKKTNVRRCSNFSDARRRRSSRSGSEMAGRVARRLSPSPESFLAAVVDRRRVFAWSGRDRPGPGELPRRCRRHRHRLHLRRRTERRRSRRRRSRTACRPWSTPSMTASFPPSSAVVATPSGNNLKRTRAFA